MNEGRIVRLLGGVYTVEDEHGTRVNRKARGKFRHAKFSPKVGDWVDYDDDFITDVYERENDLHRPPIANVDQAVLVNSAKEPDFSFYLMDRFLVLIESEEITPVIVVNKVDLLSKEELSDIKNKLSYYETYYDVHYVSKDDKESVKSLSAVFKDQVSVLAGQTGSGKSSILNTIDPALSLKTGDVSKALGRGRHTTRHVELLRVSGGLVADTPGFSKLDFKTIPAEMLHHLYPDFFHLSPQCQFRECTHTNEPKCAVKQAVEAREIPKFRYDNYKQIYQELTSQVKRY